jgi:pimeloyl-ACP methyl ester carboxylesterase
MADLHFDVYGEQGPHILMVHGMLSSRAQWAPNLGPLSAVMQCVVVELLGHGRSPAPDDGSEYEIDAYVEGFERLREELGIEKWFLCGQSFGACLTLNYALTHPDRIIAQVFTNSTSAMAQDAAAEEMADGARRQADRIQDLDASELTSIPIHPANARRLPHELRNALVADARLLSPKGLANTFRHTLPGASVADRADENKTPTLLICGDRETRFHSHRDFARDHWPKCEVVSANAGHAVNLEAPEFFNQSVMGWVSRFSGG